MAFIPNFNLIEQKLLVYGVSLQEYIEGGYSLIGKISYPSAIFEYNAKYRNANDENNREVFLLIANAVLDACDHNIYHWASKLHATSFNNWQELVGSGNAKFFKLAVYAEIKTRSISDNFPEFANASTVNFSNVNLQNNTSPPIFSTDLLSKDAMAYLDETTFNKYGNDVIEDPKEMEDWFLYRTLENILINEEDGFVATVLNNKIIFTKPADLSVDKVKDNDGMYRELKDTLALGEKLNKNNTDLEFVTNISYEISGDAVNTVVDYKNPTANTTSRVTKQLELATPTSAGLLSMLDKQKIDSTHINFLGIYDTKSEFETLHPTGVAGDYAYVKDILNTPTEDEEIVTDIYIATWSVAKSQWSYSDHIVGVETITGDGVNNTDPTNPVITQFKSDWNETNVNSPKYIDNKPTIPQPATNVDRLVSTQNVDLARVGDYMLCGADPYWSFADFSQITSNWNNFVQNASKYYIKLFPRLRARFDQLMTVNDNEQYYRVGILFIYDFISNGSLMVAQRPTTVRAGDIYLTRADNDRTITYSTELIHRAGKNYNNNIAIRITWDYTTDYLNLLNGTYTITYADGSTAQASRMQWTAEIWQRAGTY